jgi:hypothetical protein
MKIAIDPQKIAEIIQHQLNSFNNTDKELDPSGLIPFTNERAMWNVADKIAELFTEEDEEGFEYWQFYYTSREMWKCETCKCRENNYCHKFMVFLEPDEKNCEQVNNRIISSTT